MDGIFKIPLPLPLKLIQQSSPKESHSSTSSSSSGKTERGATAPKRRKRDSTSSNAQDGFKGNEKFSLSSIVKTGAGPSTASGVASTSTASYDRYPRPDLNQMLPFKPKIVTSSYHPVPGGVFPPPPAVAHLMSLIPPPYCFNGPFVGVDLLMDRFQEMVLPDEAPVPGQPQTAASTTTNQEIDQGSSRQEYSESIARLVDKTLPSKRDKDESEKSGRKGAQAAEKGETQDTIHSTNNAPDTANSSLKDNVVNFQNADEPKQNVAEMAAEEHSPAPDEEFAVCEEVTESDCSVC